MSYKVLLDLLPKDVVDYVITGYLMPDPDKINKCQKTINECINEPYHTFFSFHETDIDQSDYNKNHSFSNYTRIGLIRTLCRNNRNRIPRPYSPETSDDEDVEEPTTEELNDFYQSIQHINISQMENQGEIVIIDNIENNTLEIEEAP
jgi:hypothetical protein